MKGGLYTRHEVACIIAELFGGTCACDYSGNDEWLPQYCECGRVFENGYLIDDGGTTIEEELE